MFGGLSSWGAGAAAAAASLPPIGERKYLIDRRRPEAVIKIVPKNQVSEYEYLKDPILPGEEVLKRKPVPKVVRSRPPVQKPKFKESEFGLRAMRIRGRDAQPRVRFGPSDVPLRPVEENPDVDYLERLVDSPKENDL